MIIIYISKIHHGRNKTPSAAAAIFEKTSAEKPNEKESVKVRRTKEEEIEDITVRKEKSEAQKKEEKTARRKKHDAKNKKYHIPDKKMVKNIRQDGNKDNDTNETFSHLPTIVGKKQASRAECIKELFFHLNLFCYFNGFKNLSLIMHILTMLQLSIFYIACLCFSNSRNKNYAKLWDSSCPYSSCPYTSLYGPFCSHSRPNLNQNEVNYFHYRNTYITLIEIKGQSL